MIFELDQDLSKTLMDMPVDHAQFRAVQLLETAIHRSVNFLDRYPTCLFQSLWNTGWWYDSRESARHYEFPSSDARNEAWRFPSLSPVLEHWRRELESLALQRPWLLAARPPRNSLDSPLQFEIPGTGQPINYVAFASTQNDLCAAMSDGQINVFSLSSGRSKASLSFHPSLKPTALHLSQLGDRVLATFKIGRAIEWSVRNANQLSEWAVPPHVASAIIDRSHHQLVICITEGRQFQILSGEQLLYTSAFPREGISLLSAHVTSELLLFGYQDGFVQLVDLQPLLQSTEFCNARQTGDPPRNDDRSIESQAKLALLDFHGLTDRVLTVAVSQDGELIAAADAKGEIRIWRLRCQTQVASIRNDYSAASGLAFHRNDTELIVGSADRRLRVWDLETNRRKKIMLAHENPIDVCRLSPGAAHLISSDTVGRLSVWDPMQLKSLRQLKDDLDVIRSIDLSADGDKLACATFNEIQLFEVTADGLAKKQRTYRGHTTPVFAISFSSDGQIIASGDRDGLVLLWDTSSAANERSARDPIQHLYGHQCPIQWLRFSSAGSHLASAASDGIYIWETSSMQMIATVEFDVNSDASLEFMGEHGFEINWCQQTSPFSVTIAATTGKKQQFQLTSNQCLVCEQMHTKSIEAMVLERRDKTTDGDESLFALQENTDGCSTLIAGPDKLTVAWLPHRFDQHKTCAARRRIAGFVSNHAYVFTIQPAQPTFSNR